MYIFMSFASLFLLLIQNELVVGLIPRIVDGYKALPGEFPFQVSFQKKSNNNKHFCGGTIVHKKFILTAAHCVFRQDNYDVRIVAGITDLKRKITTDNIRHILTVFIHPSYHKPLPKENDIALVKIDTAFTFDDFINQVNLPLPTDHIPAGQKVYVTGWGLEKASDKAPTNKLKKTRVMVLDHEQCVKKYKGILKVMNTVFCTVHDLLLFNRGVCYGDSGGPVIANKITLVGVIKGSFHGSPIHDIKSECGSKNYPDMHSEVSKYRDWIDTTIAANV